MADRVPGITAGLDLEMPSSAGRTDAEVIAAVRDGRIEESALDAVVDRVLDLVRKAQARPTLEGPLDVDAHHALAREVAGRAIVLLKNEQSILPLSRSAKIAVIGEFAQTPRYQGAGSSQINPTRLDSAIDEIRELAEGEVVFAAGFTIDGSGDAAALRDEAVAAASEAEFTALFLGVPAEEESEGYDREHIDLPAEQLALLDAVRAANPNVIVVLSNGGVVALPFDDDVPAILETWLLGQAGGGAVADVLFGVVNPSGKLAETIPLRLEDNPSFGNFPGEHGHVRYGEGLLVGYRWYDAKGLDVRYPFGHGLSYTTFQIGDATASLNGDGDVVVTATVSNTGDVAGREVVQAYISLPGSAVQRPPRELKAFLSVPLESGETTTVQLVLRRSELAYWDVRVDRWIVESGEYVIEVGASSRDLHTSTTVQIDGDEVVLPVSLESTLDELLADPTVGEELRTDLEKLFGDEGEMLRMMGFFPIGRIDGMPLPRAETEALIAKAQKG